MARFHTPPSTTYAILVAQQQQPSNTPLLDRSATPNGATVLDAQELADLWLTIDNSMDDDDNLGDDTRSMDDNTLTARRHASASSSSNSSSPSGSPVVSRTKTTRTTTTATTAPAKRKPRTFTPLQVDQRRRRNRDSMRRVRQRKQVEVDHLRQQMELLQAKLDELDTVRNQTDSNNHTRNAPITPATAVVPTTTRHRTNSDVHVLLERIKALQIEQLGLHTAVLRHQQVAASLTQIVKEATATHLQSISHSSSFYQPHSSPAVSAAALDDQHSHANASDTDAFQWVDAVLPLLLPSLANAHNLAALVRESYHAIAAQIQRSATSHHDADNAAAGAQHVLGWRDARVVSGKWADFHFSKAFHHVTIASLAAKTWQILTRPNQNGGFQSQSLQLKVLHRLDDDTLVMARTAYVPQERKHYSSIYVLLRVQTPDGGYVIGGRTIELTPLADGNDRRRQQQQLQDALGADRTYAHMCYGLQFEPLTSNSNSNSSSNSSSDSSDSKESKESVARAASVSTSPLQSPRSFDGDRDSTAAARNAVAQHTCSPSVDNRPMSYDGSDASASQSIRRSPAPLRGCAVQYGGRIGNGSPLMAQTWAMDVLLAVLRWENACVQPLYRLTA